MVPVVIQGATTCCVAGTRFGFLGSDLNVYWIDTSEQKEFSRLNLKEGNSVWIYIVSEIKKIISVVPYNGEKLEDLIGADPVEVEV